MNRAGGQASGWGRGARGFWNKVLPRPDGCWDWTSYLDRDGMGRFTTNVDGKQRSFRAAKYAWELEHGPVPDGLRLLSIVCWNRKCVRPSHRMPIPQADIVRWINALGRPIDRADTRGEMSGRAILTDEAIREIRAYRGQYGAVPVLAKLYGVSRVTVAKVMQGKAWRHVSRGRGAESMPLTRLRELAEQRTREEAA